MRETIATRPTRPDVEDGTAPLRVGVDLTARLPVATGVDNYLEQLALALVRLEANVRFIFFLNRGDTLLRDTPAAASFRRLAWCLRPRIVRLPFQQLALPLLARFLRLDVLHSPSFILPLWGRRAGGGAGQLLTIYDTTFFSLAPMHTALHRSAAYRWAVTASMRRADLITVPSEWVKNEVTALLPDLDPARIRVTRPAIAAEFFPQQADEIDRVRARLKLDRPYILYVGTLEPRKNLVRLVEAYRSLVAAGRTEDLVLAGRWGWGCEPLLRAIRERGLGGRVHLPGYVDQELLPGLISGASLFVYPSLHEGFGFPPLEAMACGVPTVAGRSSSLIENLEGAAELAPPEDPAAIAAAMERMLCDPGLREERRRQGLARVAGLDWDRTARQTLDCYREIAPRQTAGG